MKGPGLLASVGLALLLGTAALGTPADADLWGHLAFGRDIIASGQVIQTDQYSFTSDRSWVNHEWLAEVIFAEVHRFAGPPGLVAFKLLMIGALLGLCWRHVTRRRRSLAVTLALLTFVFVGTYWRTHNVRPQLFSLVCVAALLMTLVRVDEGRRRGLLLLPPLVALWVNLHGGWIVGLGLLGMWTAVRLCDRRLASADRLMLAAAGVASMAATLINPYGIDLWRFLGETVRLGRADIQDWGSVWTYPLVLGVPWALTVTAAGVAVWRAERRPRLDYLAAVGLLAIASFRVGRLDAFFALVVVFLLAPELAALFEHVAARATAVAGGQARSAPPVTGIGIVAMTVIAVAAMAWPAVRIVQPYATCLPIAGSWMPDQDAARFIQTNQLTGRMLTWFDWGEYAIWHFGPALQVSMDGRRETVYTEATIQAHRRFYANDSTAAAYLRTLSPDYIWLPTHLPVIKTLAGAGWVPVFQGTASLVLARAGAGPFQQVAPAASGMRCFPGP